MKTITLKTIPQDLHAALKKRAHANGRSLNREIIAILMNTAGTAKFEPQLEIF